MLNYTIVNFTKELIFLDLNIQVFNFLARFCLLFGLRVTKYFNRPRPEGNHLLLSLAHLRLYFGITSFGGLYSKKVGTFMREIYFYVFMLYVTLPKDVGKKAFCLDISYGISK